MDTTHLTLQDIVGALRQNCRYVVNEKKLECRSFLYLTKGLNFDTDEGCNAAMGIAYRMGWSFHSGLVLDHPELMNLAHGWEFSDDDQF